MCCEDSRVLPRIHMYKDTERPKMSVSILRWIFEVKSTAFLKFD